MKFKRESYLNRYTKSEFPRIAMSSHNPFYDPKAAKAFWASHGPERKYEGNEGSPLLKG